MKREHVSESIITEAVDVIALGFPLTGTKAEKEKWFEALRRLVERRAPEARAHIRRLIEGREHRPPEAL